MKLSTSTNLIAFRPDYVSYFPILDSMKRLKAVGFDAVDLNVSDAGQPFFRLGDDDWKEWMRQVAALSQELDLPITLDDFDRLSRVTPSIVNVRPSGKYTVDMLSADVNLICSLFTQLRGDSLVEPDVSVGPISYRAPGELPQIVLEPRERPLVYVGMGSSGSADILAQVLRQLSDAPVDVLVGSGVQLSEAETRLLGDNIHFAGTVPAHLLAGHIDASITHGGEGTVQTACLAGVPFAGIAMQAEQSWNIEECVRYGNALRFTKNDVRRGNMRDILDRLLADEGLRAWARQLGEAMRTMDGAALAVEKIEDYLRAPR